MGNIFPSANPLEWGLASAIGINPITNARVAQEEQKEAAEKAQTASLDTWKSITYPNDAAVNAAAIQNRGQMGQARTGAYRNLASNLASRGFGPSSGMGLKGAENIEKSYLENIGNMYTNLTKYKNTPMFAPPQNVYPTSASYLGGDYGAANYTNELMEQAMGYAMMTSMLG